MKHQTPHDPNSRFARAVKIFKNHGGMLRTTQALRAGIHPGTLYAMRDSGVLEVISRGVFRLSENPPLDNPDLVTVATRIPSGVICLISALCFYELTTQIPHEVHIALPRGSEEPRLNYPPIKTYRFTGEAFTEGVDIHDLDGVHVSIYSPEKTLADCFKFRNKIGMEVVLEALKLYRSRQQFNLEKLLTYAKICRVKNIMTPYLEATI